MSTGSKADPPPEHFWGGRVRARQPAAGYRAAIDSVLLGAAVAVAPGARALELGCGSGAVVLIAACRHPEATFVGLERAPEMAALARANVAANGAEAAVSIVEGDALAPPPAWVDAFDHVFFNPPYYDRPDAVRAPRDPIRRAAFVGAQGDLALWLAAAVRLVRARGRVTLVHRADRLDDILAAVRGLAAEARVRPVHPFADAPAKRVLVSVRKGVKTPLALLPPLVLHERGGGWTREAAAIHAGEAAVSLEA